MKPYKRNVHITTILTKTLSKEQHNLTFSEFYGFFFHWHLHLLYVRLTHIFVRPVCVWYGTFMLYSNATKNFSGKKRANTEKKNKQNCWKENRRISKWHTSCACFGNALKEFCINVSLNIASKLRQCFTFEMAIKTHIKNQQ